MYGIDSLHLAADAHARARAALEFRPSNVGQGRTITGYVVRVHNPDPEHMTWGVFPQWCYADRPEISGFGGPFVVLSEIPTWAQIEAARRELFRSVPMLEEFTATALADLQMSESDRACSEERDERDSGTIYSVDARTLEGLRTIVTRFAEECAVEITAALELEPGETGLEWRSGSKAGQGLTHEELGSTLWLAVTGSGVSFTDDGTAAALSAMAEWASAQRVEGLMFGDGETVHLI